MTGDRMSVALATESAPGLSDYVDELLPGTKLFHGQYTIQSFLNSGGFGIIYLATDSLDRKVVVKECFADALCRRANNAVAVRTRDHKEAFRSLVRLFIREAKALSRLAHPNIVGVHQVFEDNDTAYMAMDYVEGHDLLALIEDERAPLAPDEVITLLKKLLRAVAFIHRKGVLHRDISPENILIRPDGEPVLIDFGAARDQVSATGRVASAMRVVKDGYSPQEFYLAGGAQIESSDLYSLAATFHHLIAGTAPPDSKHRLAMVAKGRPDPCPPLSGRIVGYPERFLAALDKALRVLPEDRIPTADVWIDMIEDGIAPARHEPAAAPHDAAQPGGGSDPKSPSEMPATAALPKSSDTVDRLISEVLRTAAERTNAAEAQVVAAKPEPPVVASSAQRIVPPEVAQEPTAETEVAVAEPAKAQTAPTSSRRGLPISPLAIIAAFAGLTLLLIGSVLIPQRSSGEDLSGAVCEERVVASLAGSTSAAAALETIRGGGTSVPLQSQARQ